MFENVKLVLECGVAGFFDAQSNVFLKNFISSQPHGRRSPLTKLVKDSVYIALQPFIDINGM